MPPFSLDALSLAVGLSIVFTVKWWVWFKTPGGLGWWDREQVKKYHKETERVGWLVVPLFVANFLFIFFVFSLSVALGYEVLPAGPPTLVQFMVVMAGGISLGYLFDKIAG